MSLEPTMMLIDGHTLFDLANPDKKKIDFEKIATSLSRIKRWCGNGALSISVAQHSVYVMLQLPPQLQLAGLVHDAHEAFTGDISTPTKRLMRSIELHNSQRKIDEIIHKMLGIEMTEREAAIVKEADMAVCAAEMYRVFGYTRTVDKCLKTFPKPAKLKIAHWTETQARSNWLQEFYRLTSTDSGSVNGN